MRLRSALLWALLLVIVAALIVLPAWQPWLPSSPTAIGTASQSAAARPSPSGTSSGAGSRTNATVTWIVDGDTLDVTFEGARTRVRLLNVDAPELGHDGAKDQCLAAAAQAALASLAPKGERVRVIPYGRDRFGRLLAAVYTPDDKQVNRELAAAGLVAPFVVGGDVRLLREVRAGRDEAADAARGLHGASRCTIAGRFAVTEAAIEALPTRGLTSAQRRAALATAETWRTRLSRLAADLTGGRRYVPADALPAATRQAYQSRVDGLGVVLAAKRALLARP